MSDDAWRVRRDRARHWVSISFGLVALAILFVPAPSSIAAPTDRHFRIEAGAFAYAPAEIAVNPGDRVTIELASKDVVHGLYLDDYGLDVVADPGQPTSLTFTADKSGAFRFRCSVTCGALHPFMIGKLTVGGNDLLWRAVGLAVLSAFAGVWLVRK